MVRVERLDPASGDVVRVVFQMEEEAVGLFYRCGGRGDVLVGRLDAVGCVDDGIAKKSAIPSSPEQALKK